MAKPKKPAVKKTATKKVKRSTIKTSKPRKKKPIELSQEIIFDSNVNNTDSLFVDNPENLPQIQPAVLPQQEILPTEQKMEQKTEPCCRPSEPKFGAVKNILKRIFSLNHWLFSIFIGIVFAGMFCTGVYVLATTYIDPTLDPDCAPGACTVKPPLTNSFSTNFSGSGDLTTTGSFHVKNDNTYQYFGSLDQASISYNGTNLVLNPGTSASTLTLGSNADLNYQLKFDALNRDGTFMWHSDTNPGYFSLNTTAGAYASLTAGIISGTSLKVIDSEGAAVFTLPTSAGSANQVLGMPASGTTLTWTTPVTSSDLSSYATTASLSSYLALGGGTMTGDLALGAHNITGTGTGTFGTVIAGLDSSSDATDGTIRAGSTTSSGRGGSLTISAGNGSGFNGETNNPAGNLTLNGGNSTSGQAGSVIISPGGGAPAGYIQLKGSQGATASIILGRDGTGDGASTLPAGATIRAGSCTSGTCDGSSIAISAGNGNNTGNGGNIILTPGAKGSSGSSGYVQVNGLLTASSITINGYTFPTDGGVAGQYLKTNGNTTMSWDSPLPTQTNNNGKFLTTNGSTASWASIDAFPSQSSNSGKYLTTDGSVVSWATVNTLPSQAENNGKFLTTDGSSASWASVLPSSGGQEGFLKVSGGAPFWSDVFPSQTNNEGKILSTNGSVVIWASINNILPSQFSNEGKFLTTNGETVSWADMTNYWTRADSILSLANNADAVKIQYDSSNYGKLSTGSDGDFTIAATGTGGDIVFDSAGSAGDPALLSDSGKIIFGSDYGSGNDESLTFDFESESNTVNVSSATGVTEIDFGGSIKLTTGLTFDPPSVLYDPITRQQISDMTFKIISPDKQDGASLFFNKDTHSFEYFVASENKFYDLNDSVISQVDLSNSGSAGSGNVVGVNDETFSARVVRGLASLGVTIQKGIITATSVKVKTAEIGQLQMADKATGDVYCAWVENGELMKAKGNCSTVSEDLAEPIATAAGATTNVVKIVQQAQQVVTQGQEALQKGNALVEKGQKILSDAQNVADEAAQRAVQEATEQIQQQVQQEVANQLQQAASTSDQVPVENSAPAVDQQEQETPAPVAPVEEGPVPQHPSMGNVIRNSTAGLLNNLWEFLNWLLAPVAKSAKASLLDSSKALKAGMPSKEVNALVGGLLEPFKNFLKVSD